MDKTKKLLLAAVSIFLPLVCTAQYKLIRIDSESDAWRSSQRVFFDNEMSRLLMPQGSAFGVKCIPSFSPEWTLTYDSVAHVLVYNKAQKSIWHSTYDAMHKKKTKIDKARNRLITSKLRKKPKNYQAPEVNTCSLAVSDDQAAMLRAIWKNAVYDAEDREVSILDGTKWEYFIDGRRAKSHRSENVLVKFTNELTKAVSTGNAARKDSLIGSEFQRVVSDLTITPQPL